MSFLKALFGPSKEDVWTQLAADVGGQFHQGGFFSTSAVQVQAGDWTITLDTFTQGDGKNNQTYTRLRAPYVNPEGFTFRIHRAHLFSGLGKALGMQDIEVGYARSTRRMSSAGTHRSGSAVSFKTGEYATSSTFSQGCCSASKSTTVGSIASRPAWTSCTSSPPES